MAGEVGIASSYVDEDLSVYIASPVFEAEGTVSLARSGCYLNIWSVRGFFESAGDETDVTLGCERIIGERGSVDIGVARYFFRGGHWMVLSTTLQNGRLSGRGELILPSNGGSAGGRFVGTYSAEWRRNALEGAIVFDSGSHSGLSDVVVGSAEFRRSLADRTTLSLRLQAPLLLTEEDRRNARISAALRYEF